jgi:hypothetical protein
VGPEPFEGSGYCFTDSASQPGRRSQVNRVSIEAGIHAPHHAAKHVHVNRAGFEPASSGVKIRGLFR